MLVDFEATDRLCSLTVIRLFNTRDRKYVHSVKYAPHSAFDFTLCVLASSLSERLSQASCYI